MKTQRPACAEASAGGRGERGELILRSLRAHCRSPHRGGWGRAARWRLGSRRDPGVRLPELFRFGSLVVMNINTMTFVAPHLACGEARRGSMSSRICDRGATKPQAKWGATRRAAGLFGAGGVARSSQTHEGYARRSRLACAENPLPRTSSYLCSDHLALEPPNCVALIRNRFGTGWGGQGKCSIGCIGRIGCFLWFCPSRPPETAQATVRFSVPRPE